MESTDKLSRLVPQGRIRQGSSRDGPPPRARHHVIRALARLGLCSSVNMVREFPPETWICVAVRRGGVDAGDHPPLHPCRVSTEAEVRRRSGALWPLRQWLRCPDVGYTLDKANQIRCPPASAQIGGGDAWRLYELVTRRFLASVSPPCLLERSRVVIDCGGEKLSAAGCKARRARGDREALQPACHASVPPAWMPTRRAHAATGELRACHADRGRVCVHGLCRSQRRGSQPSCRTCARRTCLCRTSQSGRPSLWSRRERARAPSRLAALYGRHRPRRESMLSSDPAMHFLLCVYCRRRWRCPRTSPVRLTTCPRRISLALWKSETTEPSRSSPEGEADAAHQTQRIFRRRAGTASARTHRSPLT